jgi:hypothetical protein
MVTTDQPQINREDRMSTISERAVSIARQAKQGEITDVEAMAQITEHAAQLYEPYETNIFVQDVGEIFVGFSGFQSPLYAADATLSNKLLGYPIELDPSSEFTIYTPDLRLADTGFVKMFRDESSQVRHFWFAVQLEMIYPTNLVMYQAFAHENPNHILGHRDGTQADAILSILGSQLGRGLANGTIKPSDVGDWIRTHLSEDQVYEYRLR